MGIILEKIVDAEKPKPVKNTVGTASMSLLNTNEKEIKPDAESTTIGHSNS